jgi:hypothetical protein
MDPNSWLVWRSDDQEEVHVVPTVGREHDLDLDACWCLPKTETHEECTLVIHELAN